MKFRKPMTAKNFEDNEHRVAYPCLVQPKLDGVRCVTDGRRFWSKNGKRFPDKNVAHLKTMIALPYLIDGELMIPNQPFEESISALKHASNDDRSASRKLRFYVFDVMTKAIARQRDYHRVEVVADARMHGAQWNVVPSYHVRRRVSIDAMLQRALKQGQEGLMIRDMHGRYTSTRSYNLLKFKPLLDAEFEVVDVKEAKGKDKGTPIFICAVGKPKDGLTFRVRPMGTQAQRRRMWKDRRDLIGCMLTVEYQNLTKHGKPRFPRAKVFRDYE